MSREELQSRLARSADVSEDAASLLLDELARVASEELKNNGAFVLPKLGIFERRESSARVARNPLTGEPINLPAKVNLRFEIASRLRHAVLASHPEREGAITTSLDVTAAKHKWQKG
jgi:nucleoid DNA-binding protein